jgi:hypothetical protein
MCMSLTPLDEQRRDRSETAPGGASTESVVSRLRARATAVLDRVPLLNRFVGPGDEPTEPVDETGSVTVVQAVETSPVAVDGLPNRDQPFVVPAHGTDGPNPADLDATVDEHGLTLSLGTNPEATITSDVYQDVER